MKVTLAALLSSIALAACSSLGGYGANYQTNPSGSGVFCQDIRSAGARSACEQRAVTENGIRQDWLEQARQRQAREDERIRRRGERKVLQEDGKDGN